MTLFNINFIISRSFFCILMLRLFLRLTMRFSGMYNIIKRITLGSLLLLIMPILLWVSGWHWCPGSNELLLKVLYWVTETATLPWGGVLASVILGSQFLWRLHLRYKAAIGVVILLYITILVGQGIKVIIKERVQEPRPFVVWLEHYHGMNKEYFYLLDRKQRSLLVAKSSLGQNLVPSWLSTYWQFETDSAYPSGHTVFVTTWALLGVGLLWPRGHYTTVVLLMLWAVGVMGSRLILGMHWPRDLVMGTLIAWLLGILTSLLVTQWYKLLVPLQERGSLSGKSSQITQSGIT